MMATPNLPPVIRAAAIEFKGAQLGFTLSQWKALPFPDASIAVAPVCTGEPDAPRIGLTLSADEQRAGDVVCGYAYEGPTGPGPRKPVPIDDRLMAEKVRYTFHAGRLDAISYQTSVDGFDAIIARISAQLGAPSAVQRGRADFGRGEVLPRVTMHWAAAGGEARLVDPSPRPDKMSVTYWRASADARPATLSAPNPSPGKSAGGPQAG
jgi:hypothetical protein